MGDSLERYLSKSLSFLLRHNSDEFPISINGRGFASMDDVLAAINAHSGTKGPITAEDVFRIVASDEKGRFQISEEPGRTLIRALSGHSFPVEIEGEDFVPQAPLWFGTTMEAYERIDAHGLTMTTKLKTRLYEDREDAERVAATRRGSPLLVEVDAETLYSEGHRFLKLPNGEVVTDPVSRERCTLHPSASPKP